MARWWREPYTEAKAQAAGIHGQEVRQPGCPRVRLHRLNSSPPGPGSPLGNDAETRCLAVAGSYEESGDLPGQTEPQ